MSELEKALAAVGESAPERPTYADYHDGTDAVRSYASELEALSLRLAVRLAAKSCPVCAARQRVLCQKPSGSTGGGTCYLISGHDGPCEISTWEYFPIHGTGKEPPR